jgi:hypothetical protein
MWGGSLEELGTGTVYPTENWLSTIKATGNLGLDHELSGPTYMCTDFPTCS